MTPEEKKQYSREYSARYRCLNKQKIREQRQDRYQMERKEILEKLAEERRKKRGY